MKDNRAEVAEQIRAWVLVHTPANASNSYDDKIKWSLHDKPVTDIEINGLNRFRVRWDDDDQIGSHVCPETGDLYTKYTIYVESSGYSQNWKSANDIEDLADLWKQISEFTNKFMEQFGTIEVYGLYRTKEQQLAEEKKSKDDAIERWLHAQINNNSARMRVHTSKSIELNTEIADKEFAYSNSKCTFTCFTKSNRLYFTRTA